MIGKVLEVFIPDEDKINSSKIGFKINTDNKIITIIEKQNEINSNILKDDIVLINKQTISKKEFIDITLYDGE